MSDVLLISRDERTASLFRSSWKNAITRGNLQYSDYYTGVSLFEKLTKIPSILKKSKEVKKTVVFGLSEAIVLFLFIRGDVYFVFTGLGRSWLNIWSKLIIKLILAMFFSKKNIAVLNQCDLKEMERLGCKNVTRLNGEGHPLLDRLSGKRFEQIEAQSTLSFVYVGRLLKSKGIKSVLEFLCYVSEKGSSIDFSCIGDQDFDNGDSVSSDDLHIYESKMNKLLLLGYCEDPWRHVTAHDIYITGSRREGLAFSVLEALHHGLFCVLSNVPGHSDFLSLPGVVSLEHVNIEDLKNEYNEWVIIPIERRLILRHSMLYKYSMSQTINEKLFFLEVNDSER